MSDALTQNRSVLNPGDMAMSIDEGSVGQGTTVGQWFEKMGIKWETPLPEALEKIKLQSQNATGLGKAQSMAPPAAPAAPGGMAPGASGGMPAPQGLDGLMG